MMTCEEVTAIMSDALDGRLDKEAWIQLQEHIEACQSCWSTWAAFREADTLLKSAPLVAPPAGFAARAAQAAVAAHRRRTWLISVIALTVGGMLIAFLMGLAALAQSGALYYVLALPTMPEVLETFFAGFVALVEGVWVMVNALRQVLLGPLFWPAAITFILTWMFLLTAGVFGRQMVVRRVQH